MQPAAVDWGQAFQIVLGGVVAVFVIMSLLAISTSLMGRIFQNVEKRKAEAEKAKEAKS